MEDPGDEPNVNAGDGDGDGANLQTEGGLNANAGGGGGNVDALLAAGGGGGGGGGNLTKVVGKASPQTEVVTNDVDNLRKVAKFINDNLSDGNVTKYESENSDAHKELLTYVETLKKALLDHSPPLNDVNAVQNKLREIVKELQGIDGGDVKVTPNTDSDTKNILKVNEAIENAGLSNFQPPEGPGGGQPNSGGGENLERPEPTKEITVVKAAYEAAGNKTGIRFGLPNNSEDYPYIGPDSIKGAGLQAGLKLNDLVIEINGTHMRGFGAPDDDRGTTKDYITKLMDEKASLVFKVFRKG